MKHWFLKSLSICILTFSLSNLVFGDQKVMLQKLATDLDRPWGMTFVNKNLLLVTEKKGKINLISTLTGKKTIIKHNLKILSYGQGGLLDILYDNLQERYQ